MKLTPYDNCILVKVIEEEKSAGGIIIPDTSKDRGTFKAEVIAVGRKFTKAYEPVKNTLKIGDKIIFIQHSGESFRVATDTLRIVYHDEVIATYE